MLPYKLNQHLRRQHHRRLEARLKDPRVLALQQAGLQGQTRDRAPHHHRLLRPLQLSTVSLNCPFNITLR